MGRPRRRLGAPRGGSRPGALRPGGGPRSAGVNRGPPRRPGGCGRPAHALADDQTEGAGRRARRGPAHGRRAGGGAAGMRGSARVARMHVNLLGPIEAVTDHGVVGLGGAKQRAVLAMLALQTGSTVSAERLIDGLWGDGPPASAVKLVQLYVSHLR